MRTIKRISIGIIFFVIYFISFVYTIIFTNETGWLLFWFLTFMLIFEGLSIASPLGMLLISTSQKQQSFSVGEYVTIQVKIQSLYNIPLYFYKLKIEFPKLIHSKELTSYYGRKRTLKVAWQPKNRGVIQQQDVLLETADFFHWLNKKKKVTLQGDWLILPAHHTLMQEGILLIEQAMKKNSFGESSYSLKSYREYREGESVKQIDWKTSSRMEMLMTREYELDEPNKWLIVFYGINSIYFEEMLSLFYTLFLEYPTQARFLMLGDELYESLALNSLLAFARIQPLEEIALFPYQPNESVCVLVPEVTEEISMLFQTKQFHLISYEDVIRGGVQDAF